MIETYTPAWLEQLAPDVKLVGAVQDGTVIGAENVKTILTFARTMYAFQDFAFKGDLGPSFFMELYSSQVDGKPISNVVLIHRNREGRADHITMNHFPLSAVLNFSKRLHAQFGDRFGEKLFFQG